MCVVVENWHTTNTLCDIAPPPLGDGFVDVQDLIMLAEPLFEEIAPEPGKEDTCGRSTGQSGRDM